MISYTDIYHVLVEKAIYIKDKSFLLEALVNIRLP